MRIEYKSELDLRFSTKTDKGQHWSLLRPFIFFVEEKKFEVPANFWTDFASIPRIIWPIISPYDIGKGPIPHDFGYFTGLETKEYWDQIIIDCMALESIATWKQKVVFRAVDILGGKVWNEYRAQGTVESQLQKLYNRNADVV